MPPPTALDHFLETVDRNARLDADARGAPAPTTPAARVEPAALVLVITCCHCECGHITRNVNPSVLVRYDARGLENSVHYQRRTLARYGDLPRELREVTVRVPFCEMCFSSRRLRNMKGTEHGLVRT